MVMKSPPPTTCPRCAPCRACELGIHSCCTIVLKTANYGPPGGEGHFCTCCGIDLLRKRGITY